MNSNSRLRVIKNKSGQEVRVITDPSLKMFAVYDDMATSIKSYRKNEKFVDGRTILDANDKGITLKDDNDDFSTIDYRDVVNLLNSPVETNGEAEEAEVQKTPPAPEAKSPTAKGGGKK